MFANTIVNYDLSNDITISMYLRYYWFSNYLCRNACPQVEFNRRTKATKAAAAVAENWDSWAAEQEEVHEDSLFVVVAH